MPTWRDRLASRARGAIGRTVRRVAGRLRPVFAPEPVEAPPAPVEPRPVAPSAVPVDPVEVRNLVEQLGELTVAAQEIQRRLVELGHAEAAEAITGLPPAPTPRPPIDPLPPPDLPELVPAVPVEPPALVEPAQAQPVGEGPPPPDEPPPEPGEGPEEPPDRQPLSDEERYLLSGTSLYIAYQDPMNAFSNFKEVWERAAIGAKRDENNRPIGPKGARAPYGADAVARADTADPGTRIPPRALRGPTAWMEWIKDNGYSDGLSIQIVGLLAPPGGRIVAASERKEPWIAPMKKKDPNSDEDES